MITTPKNILVVEDEDMLASILVNQLKKLGHNVTHAKDGEEGLSLIEDTQPDLIITDVLLPVVDGITMIKKIRENDNETPVIVLTNLEEVEDTTNVIVSPRDLILKKTYHTLGKLVEIIQEKIIN